MNTRDMFDEVLSEEDLLDQLGVFWETTLDFKEYVERLHKGGKFKGKAFSFYAIALSELEKAAMSFKLAYEFQIPDREEK